MALCFASVVILSFFTGITIGYITFEFYIIKKNKITFSFIEGDEVNKFLEEIRKSKDNGAKMLNYNTSAMRKSPSASSTLERTLKKEKNQESLSARMRQNMQIETPDEIIANTVSITIDDDALLLKEDVEIGIEEGTMDAIPVAAPTIEYADESDEMEFDVPDDDDEFEFDEDFMKKYYVTDAPAAISATNVAEDVPYLEDDENSASILSEEGDYEFVQEESSSPPEILSNDNGAEAETLSSDTTDAQGFRDEATIVTQDDNSAPLPIVPEPDKETKFNSGIEANTNIAIPVTTSSKNDKIESNVCIPLGSGSAGIGFSQGSVSIPLVMTEKPVEPSEPPKRKRGRPRKNKTS